MSPFWVQLSNLPPESKLAIHHRRVEACVVYCILLPLPVFLHTSLSLFVIKCFVTRITNMLSSHPPPPAHTFPHSFHSSIHLSLPYSTSQCITWPLCPVLWPLPSSRALITSLSQCLADRWCQTPRCSHLCAAISLFSFFNSFCDSLYCLLPLPPLLFFLSNFLHSIQSPPHYLLVKLCVAGTLFLPSIPAAVSIVRGMCFLLYSFIHWH